KVFTYLGLTLLSAGLVLGLRYAYYFYRNEGFKHLASLQAAAILMSAVFLVLALGVLAALTASNRKLLEDLIYRVRQLESPPRETQPAAPAPTPASDRVARVGQRV